MNKDIIITLIVVAGISLSSFFYLNRPGPTPEQTQAKIELKQAEADVKNAQLESMRMARERQQAIEASKPVEVQVANIKADEMSLGEGIATAGAVAGGTLLLLNLMSQ